MDYFFDNKLAIAKVTGATHAEALDALVKADRVRKEEIRHWNDF